MPYIPIRPSEARKTQPKFHTCKLGPPRTPNGRNGPSNRGTSVIASEKVLLPRARSCPKIPFQKLVFFPCSHFKMIDCTLKEEKILGRISGSKNFGPPTIPGIHAHPRPRPSRPGSPGPTYSPPPSLGHAPARSTHLAPTGAHSGSRLQHLTHTRIHSSLTFGSCPRAQGASARP